MRDHSKHITKSRHEAVESLMEHWHFERRFETVTVSDACGRIAARTMKALHQLPNARSAKMDGICVHFDDFVKGMPDIWSWKCGQQWQFCDMGTALPEGFDTVIAIEKVDISDDDNILRSLDAPTERFENTVVAGTNLQVDDVLVQAGEELTPTLLSVLHMGGHNHIEVVARPRVSFIPSGNELVSPEDSLSAGKNIDSNSVMAHTKLTQWGAQVIPFPIVEDKQHKMLDTLIEAKVRSDIVVVNAGFSKGNDDCTCELLDRYGKIICHELTQVPARHCSFSLFEGTPVIGIAGPPVGAEFALDLFVKPFIDLYLSRPLYFPPVVNARMLDASKPGPPNLTVIKRAILRRTPEDEFVAWTAPLDGRPILRNCTYANAFISLTPNLPGWNIGDFVNVELRWPYELPPIIDLETTAP